METKNETERERVRGGSTSKDGEGRKEIALGATARLEGESGSVGAGVPEGRWMP